MIRINIERCSASMTFTVEGKLTQPWITELEKCWRDAITGEPAVSIRVRLAAVMFIDRDGIELLTVMRRRGAVLVPTGLLMNAVVEEIEGQRSKEDE